MSLFVKILLPFHYFLGFLYEQSGKVLPEGFLSQLRLSHFEKIKRFFIKLQKLAKSNSWNKLITFSIEPAVDPKGALFLWFLQ